MANYVIFVHGIGEQTQEDYNDFGARLEEAVNKETIVPGPPRYWIPFRWKLAYWADVVQPDEENLKGIVNRRGLLYDFLIGSFGDLIAYSKLPYPPDRYSAIQYRFREAVWGMANLAKQLNDSNARLHVIGHSLGSVIASDGLYNMIRAKEIPDWLTFTSFFTMGSPLALYGLRYGRDNFTKPIRPPLWLNFYYPQDPVAFPLKKLNSAYNEAVTEDICLPPDSLKHRLVALLPGAKLTSHSWYFTDQRVVREIARAIAHGY